MTHCKLKVHGFGQGVATPHFTATAGSLDFHWGDDTGKLVEALITFLYLDFIGSSITFVSMGQMCGILDDKGGIPHSNKAFIAGAWVRTSSFCICTAE